MSIHQRSLDRLDRSATIGLDCGDDESDPVSIAKLAGLRSDAYHLGLEEPCREPISNARGGSVVDDLEIAEMERRYGLKPSDEQLAGMNVARALGINLDAALGRGD